MSTISAKMPASENHNGQGECLSVVRISSQPDEQRANSKWPIPDMTFSEAAELYLEMRAPGGRIRYIKENTEKSYREYIRSLKLVFGKTKLRDIHWFNMKTYQKIRIAGEGPFVRYRRPQDAKSRVVNGVIIPAKGMTSCPAQPQKINQELMLLIAIKKRAQCWTNEDENYYERLQEVESELPRALTLAEQHRWLDISRSNQKWMLVHWYSILALETSMSTNEIRALHIGNVNLESGVITVPVEGAKNKYRIRSIPLLSPEVQWAVEQLLSRARALGAGHPQHYLFPFRDKRAKFDPTRPMTVAGLKTKWNEVRQASGLTGFRQYDCRHTAITRWAESGMPLGIIMDMAGHISPSMSRHYTHISEQGKIGALQQAMRHVYPGRPEAQVRTRMVREPYRTWPAPVVPPVMQMPAPRAAPQGQSASSPATTFAGGFYSSGSTW